MVINIRDIKGFKKIADSVKPDNRKRVGLHKVQIQEGVSYHIYANSTGQIFLDPQVTIPASEAWLYKNPDAIAAVRQGLLEAAQGKAKTIDMDSL